MAGDGSISTYDETFARRQTFKECVIDGILSVAPIGINVVSQVAQASIFLSQSVCGLVRFPQIYRAIRDRNYPLAGASLVAFGIGFVPQGRAFSILVDIAAGIGFNDRINAYLKGLPQAQREQRPITELFDPNDLDNAYRILYVKEADRRNLEIIKTHYTRKVTQDERIKAITPSPIVVQEMLRTIANTKQAYLTVLRALLRISQEDVEQTEIKKLIEEVGQI